MVFPPDDTDLDPPLLFLLFPLPPDVDDETWGDGLLLLRCFFPPLLLWLVELILRRELTSPVLADEEYVEAALVKLVIPSLPLRFAGWGGPGLVFLLFFPPPRIILAAEAFCCCTLHPIEGYDASSSV